MKTKALFLRMVVLIATMMSALGANAAEAYACYTPDNTTLTFYCDNLRSSRDGTTYDLNTGSNDPVWLSYGTSAKVTRVVFDLSFADARPTTTCAWFDEMEILQSIEGMKYLNTSEVTNMESMFSVCKKMASLDLSHFNTSNVTNMDGMFNECSKLTSLDLSSFNTSKVTEMMNMFYGCFLLKTIYVGEGWSTASIEVSDKNYTMDMFYDCTRLVGGQGTTYDDSNPKDKTYARIDGGPDDPGYFTERTTLISTGLENGQRDTVKRQRDEWFTIDGQKLSGKPTKRGVYIYNGRAVVR